MTMSPLSWQRSVDRKGAKCETIDRSARSSRRYLDLHFRASFQGRYLPTMLAGPMDFTPGGFRNVTAEQLSPNMQRPQVMGTRCHHLAMFVVYESPLAMVCDDPAEYRG